MSFRKPHLQRDIPVQISTECETNTSTTSTSSKKLVSSDARHICEQDEEKKSAFQDSLQKERTLLREAENQAVASISEAGDSFSQLHAVKTNPEKQRETLDVYVIPPTSSDVWTTEKSGAMLSRMRRVREDSRPFSEAEETPTDTSLESEANKTRNNKPDFASEKHQLPWWRRLFKSSDPKGTRRYVSSWIFLPISLIASLCLVLLMALMMAQPKHTSPDPAPHPSWIDPFQHPVPFRFNPGHNKPKKLNSYTLYETSQIKSLIVTKNSQVVVTDADIRGVILKSPQRQTESMLLSSDTFGLAHLRGGLVAVTSWTQKRIFLLNIDDGIHVNHDIITTRHYYGVAPNNDDSTMIVSCKKDADGPARIDVIAISDGSVKKTVVERSFLAFMNNPCYLTIVNGDLLVSDCEGSTVYQVDLRTGLLRTMHGVPRPQSKDVLRQVASDLAGNLYVASRTLKCIIVKIPGSSWKCLTLEHSEFYQYPEALAVKDTGQLVVSWQSYSDLSQLIEYDLRLTDNSDSDSV